MAKFDDGITRNPYHPKGKQVLAVNMDKLGVKLNGKEIPIEDVQGAFPQIETVLVFKRTNGEIVVDSDHNPVVEGRHGKVEIIGTPTSCGCSMSKFKVPQWWNKKLLG